LEPKKVVVRPGYFLYLLMYPLLGIFVYLTFEFLIQVITSDDTSSYLLSSISENRLFNGIGIVLFGILVFNELWKHWKFRVVFTESRMIVPKKPPAQMSSIDILCSDILGVKVLLPDKKVTLGQFIKSDYQAYLSLEFFLKDDSTIIFWSRPFTKPQMEKIITMIKERGGMQREFFSEQDLSEQLNKV